MIVCDQLFKINFIVLRNNTVDKLPAHFATARNQFTIGRRNHYQWIKTDMLGQPFVFLLISLELFFLIPFYATVNLLTIAVFHETSLDHKKSLFIPYVLRIN